jgi:hypothetical protein
MVRHGWSGVSQRPCCTAGNYNRANTTVLDQPGEGEGGGDGGGGAEAAEGETGGVGAAVAAMAEAAMAAMETDGGGEVEGKGEVEVPARAVDWKFYETFWSLQAGGVLRTSTTMNPSSSSVYSARLYEVLLSHARYAMFRSRSSAGSEGPSCPAFFQQPLATLGVPGGWGTFHTALQAGSHGLCWPRVVIPFQSSNEGL